CWAARRSGGRWSGAARGRPLTPRNGHRYVNKFFTSIPTQGADNKRMKKLILAASLAVTGCSSQVISTAPAAKAKPAITVERGGSVVAKQVQVTLASDKRKLAAVDAFPYTLSQVAQVPAIKVGTETVQA